MPRLNGAPGPGALAHQVECPHYTIGDTYAIATGVKGTKNIHTVRGQEDGWGLQKFLAARLALSGRKAKSLLDDRCVLVNRRRMWMARHVVRRGDQILIIEQTELSSKLRVLWMEDPFLVLDKPPGVVSNGPGSLETRLQSEDKFSDWRAVHRLDRDTSGCILFAASLRDKDAIVKQFRSNSIRKIYHAIVTGKTSSARASLKAPLDEKKAVTRFEVLDSNRLATHIRIELRTGRTHQIRKHMAATGHQVVGDKTYSTGSPIGAEFQDVPRQMLHAQKFGFIHPETKKEIRVAAPLPPDFRRTLKSLRLR